MARGWSQARVMGRGKLSCTLRLTGKGRLWLCYKRGLHPSHTRSSLSSCAPRVVERAAARWWNRGGWAWDRRQSHSQTPVQPELLPPVPQLLRAVALARLLPQLLQGMRKQRCCWPRQPSSQMQVVWLEGMGMHETCSLAWWVQGMPHACCPCCLLGPARAAAHSLLPRGNDLWWMRGSAT